MITVHHLNNSRSQRILWLLEELNLPYEVIRYERDPETMLAPATLRKIHPLGKSPLITEDGKTLAESGAIIEYLLAAHDGARLRPPAGTTEALRFTYWLHYAEGSAMMPLLLTLIFSKMSQGPMPFFIRPVVKGIAEKVRSVFVNPQLKLHLDYMESELNKSLWFAGEEFTAADIQMSFVVEAAGARKALENRPRLAEFLKRIQARPAYQRALEKGGPYDLLS
jgi:glutathione S-transferase